MYPCMHVYISVCYINADCILHVYYMCTIHVYRLYTTDMQMVYYIYEDCSMIRRIFIRVYNVGVWVSN
jgi:hypothetical protein